MEISSRTDARPSVDGELISPARAVSLGVVGMQYGPTLAVGGAYIVAASPSAPLLLVVLTSVTILCLARVIVFFARRYAGSGGIFTYISESASPVISLMAAATLFIGYVATLSTAVNGASLFLSGIFYNLGISEAVEVGPQLILVSVLAAGMFAAAGRGIQVSAMLARTLGLACVPVILFVMAAYLMKVGVDIPALIDPSGFQLSAGIAGLVLGVAVFIGFDGVASLANRTSDPLRNMPRIIMWVAAVGIPVLAMTVIVQAPVASSPAFAEGESPLSIMARDAGVAWLGLPADLLLLASMFAAGVAAQSFAGNVFAAMGRIGLLPTSMSRTNRHGIATRSMALAGLLSLIVVAGASAAGGGVPAAAGQFIYAAAAHAWGIAYMLVCAVAIWVAARERPHRRSVICCGVFAFLMFGSLELNGLRTGYDDPLDVVQGVCVGAAAVAMIVFLVISRSRKSAIDLRTLDTLE